MLRTAATLALLTVPVPLMAATPLPVAEQIRSYAEAVARSEPTGFSLAVTRRGHIVIARGFGTQSSDIPRAAEPVYHVDSVTKQITATAIMLLVRDGKLSLDDRASKYVPELAAKFPTVTIRHLLTHTSGIEDYTVLPTWSAVESKPLSHADVLARIANGRSLFAPGTQWQYSNSGFFLLGVVIERVSGETYGAFVTGHIFKPFGMAGTTYACRDAVPGHRIANGKASAAPAIFWDSAFSAGGICSTPVDLVKFERALQTGRIVPAALVARMATQVRLTDGSCLDYGLGTRLGMFAGHPVRGHTGSGAGYQALLEYFPADDIAIAVTMNAMGGQTAPTTIAAAIARVVLKPPDPPADAHGAAAAMRRCVGTFGSGAGAVETYIEGARLMVREPHARTPLGELTYQGGDTFMLAPHITVRCIGPASRAEWGVGYEAGLMTDPKRRVR